MGKLVHDINDLPKNFKDLVIDMMREEGMSIKEVLADFGITPSAHAKFKKESEEYKDAFEIGQTFAEAWWMSQGRRNLETKGFNLGVYAFQMKNRFKWRDVPITAGDKDRKLADKYKESEIKEKYKIEKREVEDEKVIN